MNKHFFAIIILAIVSQLYGMEKAHNYQCNRHKHTGPYPYSLEISRVGQAMTAKGEYKHYSVYENSDREFDDWEHGNRALVFALKSYDDRQDTELSLSKQKITSEATRLCKLLARPIGYDGNYLPPQENNFYWNRLRDQLANPNITRWENMLNESPAFWEAAEKSALVANIFGSKKPDYFKKLLIPHISKFLAAVFNAQSLFYCLKLDEKDVLINQERNAKDIAQRSLNEKQQADNANAAALRNLEANKETYFRTLRQQLGKTAYNGQFVDLAPAYAQIVTQQRDNPPADQIQVHERALSIPELDPLYNLIIKKAQVEPHNAKALLISVMAHLRFVTINAYACPVTERLNQATANLTQAQEQQRKTQADLEASQKGKADAEGTITTLRNQKTELVRNYTSAIATVTQQKDQIGQRANRAFEQLAEQMAPLRQELPQLRTRVREQDIEIQALRRALEPRNQQ